MNLKKNISKKVILRLLLFAAMIASAVLFDTFHEGSGTVADATRQKSESLDMQSSHVFFCNPVSSFKILNGADKLFSGFLFTTGKSEFLTAYHNCRAFHLLKAETLQKRISFLEMAHFMEFNPSHHISPDDDASLI